MNNFWIMLSHTYLSKLKSKTFIITTLFIAAGMMMMSNIESIIHVFMGDDNQDRIVVIDATETVYPLLKEELSTVNENIELELSTASVESLESEVEEGIYEGILLLTTGVNGFPEAVYKTSSLTGGRVSASLEAVLQRIQLSIAATELNLTIEQLEILNAPVSFTNEAIGEGAKSEEELIQARGIVYVLLFFIYFSVIMYSSMIATEVAMEKSSRVMEILISSVSPVKQMFAKIIGIGLVGLTQMTVLLLVGYFSLRNSQDLLMGGFLDFLGFGDISGFVIFYAVVFFLLGYFLYATLAALLGSVVSRIEEVQQMIIPVVFLVMIGFFIAMFGLGAPESAFVTMSSYIPFFTPMVMFLRVGMLNLSPIEPLLGLVVLIGTIVVLAIFGARVYRGGVLMYGQSNSFKDIKKAIDITKK